MRYLKIAIGTLILCSCSLILLLYYGYRTGHLNPYILISTSRTEPIAKPTKLSLNEIHQDKSFVYFDHNNDYILNTTGCKIPLSMVYYLNTTKVRNKFSCNQRAILLKKVGENKIKVSYQYKTLKQYLRGKRFSHCCYHFIKSTKHTEHENKRIKYGSCKHVNDSDIITLYSDFIKISCYGTLKHNRTLSFYDDVYGFVRKRNIIQDKNKKKSNKNNSFNVLLLGMDSMSFPRVVMNMPRVNMFMKEHYWLWYRGYHKVGDNTMPNIIAALTGKQLSSIYNVCPHRMDDCNNFMIWSKFKNSGYVTAFGEDYLRLPDTFSGHRSFHKQPTDHYMRPLFQTGEREIGEGSLICTGKVSSGQQLLDYALDFAKTYKNDSFFGAFWMNSYSHNNNGNPRDADKIIEKFLFHLTYTEKVLETTFVIFLSDHGLRFGPQRMTVESYYDERLPAFFLWVPPLFRIMFPDEYKNVLINQQRLITPYDLYSTFEDIYKISRNDLSQNDIAQCPKCRSLFHEISPNRTCSDANIHNKWCSCHKMYPLDDRDTEGLKSVTFVISHIKKMSTEVKTKSCWGCSLFSLKNIIRIHYYYDDNGVNLYHVVAFTLTPGNISYEATVLKYPKDALEGAVSVISAYRGLGTCVVHRRDRLYCACQKVEKCHAPSA